MLDDLLGPGLDDLLADLAVLAEAKFDSYGRYPPLTGFWDAFAGWLRQADPADRPAMVRWVARELLFVSREQVASLVGDLSEWLLRSGADPDRTTVCALSDGVAVGELRRAMPYLSHSQFWTDPLALPADAVRDGHLVLVDDFSGTGKSLAFVRADGSLAGRLFEMLPLLREPESVTVVLLMASGPAARHLTRELGPYGIGVRVIQELPASSGEPLAALSRKYLDLSPDPSAKTEVNAGYLGGDLPVVLQHNAPNDGYAIVWSDVGGWRPLFPRFSRIRDTGR